MARIETHGLRHSVELEYRSPPSERALGPTATYLLAHRPCRVVIETPPATARRRRGERRDQATGSRPRAGRPRHPTGASPSEREAVADPGVGADEARPLGAGSILRRRFAMCARRTRLVAVARPQTDGSSSRWVISCPRLRPAARSSSNSVGVRWTSSPSSVRRARRGRRRARRARSRGSSGSGRAAQDRLQARDQLARPNGLVT